MFLISTNQNQCLAIELKKELLRTLSCSEKTIKDFKNSRSRRNSSISVLSKGKSEVSDKIPIRNKHLIEEEVAQIGGVINFKFRYTQKIENL